MHSRPHRSFSNLCLRLLILTALLAAIVFSIAFYVIESGSLDRFLLAKANEQIRSSMPAGYRARISDATLRLGAGMNLELKVGGVRLSGAEDKEIAAIGTLAFAIDPMALARGQVSVTSVSADDIKFDSSALPSTGTFRLTEHRVDVLPELVEAIFDKTDFVRGILTAAETRSIALSDIEFPVGSASPGKTVAVDIRELSLNLLPDGILRADGEVSLDGTVTQISAEATEKDGLTESLQAEVSDLLLTPFLLRANANGDPALGIEGTADVALQLKRAPADGEPEVYAAIDIATGSFLADTIARPFSDARLNVTYDNTKHSVELTDSEIEFDGSRFPFTGGIIDLDRVDPTANDGYGLDFLIKGGRFKSREPGLPPLIFDAKATGEFRPAEPHLLLDNIAVSSPQGMMAASFKATFGEDGSPEMSFGARIEQMDAEAVKQLWPFWIARKPREWVSNNLHGGVVTNGDIAVFLPAGRLEGHGIPINLDESELRIGFDIDDTRITLNDTFPDVGQADAHVRIEGGSVNVGIDGGGMAVAKGRSIRLDSGTFSIANTYEKPLIGAVDVKLSGSVQDLLTLADAPPINALKQTDYTPADFSGDGVVNVKASFPLEAGKSAMPADWHVEGDLTAGAIAKPVSGYDVGALVGHVDIVPQRIVYKGRGAVDGIPIDIDWSLPFGKPNKGSTLVVAGTLNDAQRDKLVPGVGSYVVGPMALTLNSAENVNTITLDLTQASLSLPWIGWGKPAGVAAKLTFDSSAKDGVTTLSKLKLSGSGLSAAGEVVLDKAGLRSATLSGVQLAAGDDFNVAIQHDASKFDIAVTGRSFSAANLLAKLTRGGGSGSGGKDGNETVDLRVDLARIGGEGDRYLAGASGDLSIAGGQVRNGKLSATTQTGQPLTVQIQPDNGDTAVHVRTSGTGALLRFFGVYQKMSGGTLNFDIIENGDGWRGMLTLTDFDLINDDQLRRLLSTPTAKDGKSLNATYRNQINEASQHFQRAQAVVDLSNGVLRVSDAFVRGDQVGATFKGVVRDAAGNMDMTGTFMPAYGLNRIFAEIPLIGPILGNGQDKGLFGITFKLTGKTQKPDLIINPLSAIAPGVFRRIFEFQ